jgi:hypothetical protein
MNITRKQLAGSILCSAVVDFVAESFSEANVKFSHEKLNDLSDQLIKMIIVNIEAAILANQLNKGMNNS